MRDFKTKVIETVQNEMNKYKYWRNEQKVSELWHSLKQPDAQFN